MLEPSCVVSWSCAWLKYRYIGLTIACDCDELKACNHVMCTYIFKRIISILDSFSPSKRHTIQRMVWNSSIKYFKQF